MAFRSSAIIQAIESSVQSFIAAAGSSMLRTRGDTGVHSVLGASKAFTHTQNKYAAEREVEL